MDVDRRIADHQACLHRDAQLVCRPL
jgi:hypothetical protein